MKNIRIIVAVILATAALVSCGKSADEKKLVGEWSLESFGGFPAENQIIPSEVYISFSANDFVLFQKVGGGHFVRYSGTCVLEGNVLSGVYDDGHAWASAYEVSFQGKNRMEMKVIHDGDDYVNVYVRCAIPDDVREEAEIYTPVKSADVSPLL